MTLRKFIMSPYSGCAALKARPWPLGTATQCQFIASPEATMVKLKPTLRAAEARGGALYSFLKPSIKARPNGTANLSQDIALTSDWLTVQIHVDVFPAGRRILARQPFVHLLRRGR